MKPLIDANHSVLMQLEDLIKLLDNDAYNLVSPNTQSSIGKHIRHILDHFRAVKLGLKSGDIDYNHRSRDSEEEKNATIALSEIAKLSHWFENHLIANKTINVISEIQIYQHCSKTFSSDLERELLYLINHSIHHMAYAALLAKLQGIDVPSHIGLAPSTASYLRTLKESSNETQCA